MSTDKKKRFSFFDLSDDNSFGTLDAEPEIQKAPTEQINNPVSQQPIPQPEVAVKQPEQVVVQPQQVIKTVQVKQVETNPKVEEKLNDDFYGKVEAFVPSPKKEEVEVITEEEIIEEIVPVKEQEVHVETKPVQPTTQVIQPNIQPEVEPRIEEPQVTPKTNISNKSLNGFFDVKEKLDVKTNIYIKK